MARVRQGVEIHQPFYLGPVNDMMDDIRADEPSAAGNQQIHIVYINSTELNLLGNPIAQGIFERVADRAHFNARAEQLRDFEHTIGPLRFGSEAIKLFVILPELKTPRWLEDSFDHFHDLASSNEARISHVINAKGRAALPQVQTGADEIPEVGD